MYLQQVYTEGRYYMYSTYIGQSKQSKQSKQSRQSTSSSQCTEVGGVSVCTCLNQSTVEWVESIVVSSPLLFCSVLSCPVLSCPVLCLLCSHTAMHPPPPPPPHPHTSSPQGGEGGAKGGKRACTVQSCNQLSKKCSIYAVQSLYLTYSTLLLYIHIHRNRLCSFEGELGSKSTSLLCGAVLRSTSCFHYGVGTYMPTYS